MVRAGLKGKKLGKDKKLELIADRKKAVEARKSKDDKKWKRVLSKMDGEKKKAYGLVGDVTKGRVRGATRASLRKKGSRKPETVSYETTIHMSKLLKKKTFHKRAPIAIKRIKAFAKRMMKTKDNRVDSSLNTFVWSRGVKGVPSRIRVRIDRKVAEAAEGAKKKRFYTVISNVPVASFKNLTTKTVTSQ